MALSAAANTEKPSASSYYHNTSAWHTERPLKFPHISVISLSIGCVLYKLGNVQASLAVTDAYQYTRLKCVAMKMPGPQLGQDLRRRWTLPESST